MNEWLFLELNRYVGLSNTFDGILFNIVGNPLCKGGVLMALFWALWGWAGAHGTDLRSRLLAMIFVTLITVISARALVFVTPYSLRPIHTDGLDINLAYEGITDILDGWSSFPSDHAVPYFGISTSLFLVNRQLGAFAYVYTTIVICLPRVMMGLHWPADILGGAVAGIAFTLLLTPLFVRFVEWLRLVKPTQLTAAVLYPLMFLATYQIATLFNDSRRAVSAMAKFVIGS